MNGMQLSAQPVLVKNQDGGGGYSKSYYNDLYIDSDILHKSLTKLYVTKYAEPEPFDLERLCREALSRLHYAINANANYAIRQMREQYTLSLKEFSAAKLSMEMWEEMCGLGQDAGALMNQMDFLSSNDSSLFDYELKAQIKPEYTYWGAFKAWLGL